MGSQQQCELLLLYRNVDKLTAITTIFPVFFFLGGGAVVSTTMTRMVEEERLQIGTLKALGYTRREIMRKYLWYALVAAVCGTAVGLTVGFGPSRPSSGRLTP